QGHVYSFRRLVAAWEKTQVELHGQYSVQRLKGLNTHMRGIGEWKNVLLYSLTPLPCLVLVTLLDCFKLDPSVNEIPASAGYWLRLFGFFVVIAVSELAQMQAAIPILALTTNRIALVSISISFVGVAATYGWAVLIGFPVPFTLPMSAPLFFNALLAGIWYYSGDVIRSDRTAQNDAKGHVMVMVSHVVLTTVYPMYAYVFMRLSSHAQTAAVLLLPVIKIVAKNTISYLLRGHDDLKPDVLNAAVEILERDNQISQHASLQVMSKQTAFMMQRGDIKRITSEAQTASKTDPGPDTRSMKPHWIASKSPGSAAKLGLNELERLHFIQKTTKVLFMTEYAVLIEYTEVVTPLIY
ncbi:hypothetical protein PybrP1_004141, partial [[Pythium] brassicae (nom. inval.)]